MTGTEISLLLQIPIVGIFVFFVLKLYALQQKTLGEMAQTYSDTIYHRAEETRPGYTRADSRNTSLFNGRGQSK
jgi:hypothetical protein